MQEYQRVFADFLWNAGALRLGDFQLKSGRRSPLFLNTGLLDTGTRLARLGEGWDPIPDPRLREIDAGRWEGWLLTDIVAEAGLPEDYHPLMLYENIPDGESLEGLRDRARDFLASLDRPSLLVTHGMTSRMIRTLATGRDLDRLDEVPGGQGVVYRVRDGVHETLDT